MAINEESHPAILTRQQLNTLSKYNGRRNIKITIVPTTIIVAMIAFFIIADGKDFMHL